MLVVIDMRYVREILASVVALAWCSHGVVASAQSTLSAALSETVGEQREALSAAGINLNLVVSHDVIANLDGGVKRGTRFASNYDLIADFDTEKLGLWPAGRFHFYVLGDKGNNLPDITGQYLSASNIQAPDSIKLYEAYYEQRTEEGSSLLAGLHNYNSEFDLLLYGAVFLNSAFGIQTNISQVGPSIFPTTALAVRGRYQVAPDYYLMAAIYDGVPGDPENPRGTHVNLDSEDGLFYALEIGHSATAEEAVEHYYKLAAGAWYKTTESQAINGDATENNFGFYVIGERSLFREEDSAQGLGAFFQLGYAPADLNRFEYYLGAGLNYTGLFPSRELDVTGFAFNTVRAGDDFEDANPDFARSESIFELTHRFIVRPYFAIQPDLQYVVDPAGSPGINHATVFLTRFIATF